VAAAAEAEVQDRTRGHRRQLVELQEELQRRRAKLARCAHELQLLRREVVLTGGAGADNRLVQSSGLPRQGPHALDPLDNARPGDGLGAAGEIVEDLGW